MKRLFFGFDIRAPWPEDLPVGRTLEEVHRHLTFAFLGQCDFEKLESHLDHLPLPPLKVGLVGKFDQCLFLPPRHPHVVAWHVEWLEEAAPLLTYYKTLTEWLKEIGCPADQRHDFNPHVTLCRSPFNEKVWKKKFSPIPLMIKDFHLFESLGNLTYKPIMSIPLLPPFEEIEHIADMGYHIIGTDFKTLFLHAQAALAYSFPPLLDYLLSEREFHSVEEIVIALNEIVALADQKIGCPYKAVSFHGKAEEKDNLYHWDMIIDV